MARTITEIKTEIIDEKNKRLELSEMESDSKVSVYNSWAYITAVAIHSFEIILDIFKDDIEETLTARIGGTPYFYVSKTYEYQDGDKIEVSDDGLSIGYTVEDTSKRIITRASFEEKTISPENNDKLLLLKVAKGSTGDLSPLTNEELVRYTAYINQIKFAGTNIQAVSKTGDILIPKLTVYHDGFLPNATILSKVNDAINTFMGELSFNSALYTSKLIDAISEVENVSDVYVDDEAASAQGVFVASYNDIGELQPAVEVKRVVHMESGYLRESSKSGLEVDVPNFDDSLIIIAE